MPKFLYIFSRRSLFSYRNFNSSLWNRELCYFPWIPNQKSLEVQLQWYDVWVPYFGHRHFWLLRWETFDFLTKWHRDQHYKCHQRREHLLKCIEQFNRVWSFLGLSSRVHEKLHLHWKWSNKLWGGFSSPSSSKNTWSTLPSKHFIDLLSLWCFRGWTSKLWCWRHSSRSIHFHRQLLACETWLHLRLSHKSKRLRLDQV